MEVISDIKAGEFIKGAKEVGTIVNQFPDAFSNCKNMGDDLAEIEAWA